MKRQKNGDDYLPGHRLEGKIDEVDWSYYRGYQISKITMYNTGGMTSKITFENDRIKEIGSNSRIFLRSRWHKAIKKWATIHCSKFKRGEDFDTVGTLCSLVVDK